MGLELLYALAAVKVNHAESCISQDVAMDLREGSAPFFPVLAAKSTIPGFAPPQVQVTKTGASPVEVKGLADVVITSDWGHWDCLSWKTKDLRGNSATCRRLAREGRR